MVSTCAGKDKSTSSIKNMEVGGHRIIGWRDAEML